ncbi:SDR family NAD(P)-dependent oxidoreductase [Paenibacillus endoradicis]|uniref:SDR family NAD(P)-dependent oxidoreductase n=1 Tax=Paenibacillus endoradicis TaxID=2972487 RepID=UPI002158F5F1|nr:SDR family NAD(P)-dependent oxidoreductase [Paenibacillus endoradicis]MCR8658806.1 SDR family NAD(P)-dependent oxidoreductase [Paenibacillus endoradicis]
MSRIVIITGANSGIGKAAAQKFALEGDHVIMACRSIQRSRTIQQALIRNTGNNDITLMQLDISSFASIQQFVQQFTERFEQLDLLIHNAAYLKHGEPRYLLSEDDIELSFATNVVGPYLLTQLLLPQLGKAKQPAILHACTTNIKHFFDPKRQIEFDNMRGEYANQRIFNSYKLYGDSKMALFLLTIKLAEQVKEQRIRVNALQINRVKLSPETIANLSARYRILARLQNPTSQPPSSMADLYYDICTSTNYRDINGSLINHRGIVMKAATSEKPHPFQLIRYLTSDQYYPAYATNRTYLDQVWDFCEQATDTILSKQI